jgi:hypothetical protein
MIMEAEEFVFKLPGDPGFKNQDGTMEFDREFPLESLDNYDEIFRSAIQNWEANVRCGFILLFQRRNNDNYVPLGLMTVEDARRKFK